MVPATVFIDQLMQERASLTQGYDEGPEGRRVLEVELQLPVAETVDLLEQRDPQHLMATEPGPPRVAASALDEVPLDELSELAMCVQNPGRHL